MRTALCGTAHGTGWWWLAVVRAGRGCRCGLLQAAGRGGEARARRVTRLKRYEIARELVSWPARFSPAPPAWLYLALPGSAPALPRFASSVRPRGPPRPATGGADRVLGPLFTLGALVASSPTRSSRITRRDAQAGPKGTGALKGFRRWPFAGARGRLGVCREVPWAVPWAVPCAVPWAVPWAAVPRSCLAVGVAACARCARYARTRPLPFST